MRYERAIKAIVGIACLAIVAFGVIVFSVS